HALIPADTPLDQTKKGCAAHIHSDKYVVKGEYGRNLLHSNPARRYIGPDGAAVLDRNLRIGRLPHGVGDHVAKNRLPVGVSREGNGRFSHDLPEYGTGFLAVPIGSPRYLLVERVVRPGRNGFQLPFLRRGLD